MNKYQVSCPHTSTKGVTTEDGREALWCETCGSFSRPWEEWRAPRQPETVSTELYANLLRAHDAWANIARSFEEEAKELRAMNGVLRDNNERLRSQVFTCTPGEPSDEEPDNDLAVAWLSANDTDEDDPRGYIIDASGSGRRSLARLIAQVRRESMTREDE